MRPRHQQLLQAASRAGGGAGGRHGARQHHHQLHHGGGQHPRGWRQAVAHDCFPPVVGALGAVLMLNLLWTARLSQLEGRAVVMHRSSLLRGGGALGGGDYEFITAASRDGDEGGGQQPQTGSSSTTMNAPGSPVSTPGGDGGGAAPADPSGGWQGWLTGSGGTVTEVALKQMAHARPPGGGLTNADRIHAMLRIGGGGGGGDGGGGSGGGLATSSGETGEAGVGLEGGGGARGAGAFREQEDEEKREEEAGEGAEDGERAARAERERLARAERARARAAREKEMVRRKAALYRRIEQQQQLRAQQQLSGREGKEGEGQSSSASTSGVVGAEEEEDDKEEGVMPRQGADGGGAAAAATEEKEKKDEKKSPPIAPRRAGGGRGGGDSSSTRFDSASYLRAVLPTNGDGGVGPPPPPEAVAAVTGAGDAKSKGGDDDGGATRPPVPPPPIISASAAPAVIVALQPAVGTPLAPKIQRILRKLTDLPAVLTNRRLRDRARISCGGTGAVTFKTWSAFFHSSENLTRALPDADPPLAQVAAFAQQHCRHRGACNFTKMQQQQQDDEANVDPVAAADTKVAAARAQSLRPRPPPTCAIVGNGGRLRYETHGDAIDAAEIVVRFNNGRTKGFEKQVGRRSHFRFYNGPSVEPKQAGELTVAQLRDPAVSHWAKQYLKHRDNFPEAYVMDPEIICAAWDMVDREGDKPSSGLVGIAWAMRLCRSVDVYGFQFDAYFNETMRPHYYDWERPKPGREHAHPFERERDLYLSLAAAGLLQLH